jgi:hypothetical protein
MAIKLSTTARWRAIRKFVDNKHGIKLNFSDTHTNYYTAYEYVVKEDAEFVLSPGHPDLVNTTPPNTTNATRGRRKAAKVTKGKKRKRLAVFDVVRIIQTKKIRTRLELMALADKWQEEGKTDLAEFVCNRGPRIVNEAIETAKELSGAQERLKRCNKSRIQLLEESAAKPCVDSC